MIDFSIWVIIVFQKRNGFVSYYCNGDDTKQDKVSIENQKLNHITQWFSKISGNVVPMVSFICIVHLVYWFIRAFWHGLSIDLWPNTLEAISPNDSKCHLGDIFPLYRQEFWLVKSQLCLSPKIYSSKTRESLKIILDRPLSNIWKAKTFTLVLWQ